ncbi:unnamed protein product [Rotaria sp. Silwood1]|nr:unnamed protein product [Rotaria sp. Silwood1]CAF0865961.1 unnamed protein product [Rotaria sp. Silwood1]CAF0881442.1 unnamed protein product [Rotaria sp. Silwood1]CAF3366063.1 unnamed protein product [Rotaria sp. Silwood1]CAF3388578.1 unnamed protein product [Rotaria sp. Silwood1]
MLDANLPMKYAFVVVPIIQQSTKDLLSLPKTKDKLALTTYFVFIFEIILNDILTMHANALTHITKHGNPREMLIIIVEQSDKFISDEVYSFHIKLFSIII